MPRCPVCDADVSLETTPTLPDITGRSLPRQRLLAALLPRLLARLADVARDPSLLVERFRGRCGLTGRTVTVHVGDGTVVGTCLGIAADGRLIVDTPTGRRHVASGSLTAPGDVWHGDP